MRGEGTETRIGCLRRDSIGGPQGSASSVAKAGLPWATCRWCRYSSMTTCRFPATQYCNPERQYGCPVVVGS